MQYFAQNDKILPIEKAEISLLDIAYQYGFGVYENIKIRNNIFYFVPKHIDRLFHSAKEIKLEHNFSAENISKLIEKLHKKLQTESYNIKILLLGGATAEQAKLYILPLAPLFPDRKLYKKGVSVLSFQHERRKPEIKSLNMLASYFYYNQAKKHNGYDAILIDQQGNILEGTRTNFFAIHGKTLFTPPKKYILEGVTYLTVIHTAKQNGYEIQEKLIKLEEISDYDNIFLTSTSAKIMPIKNIYDGNNADKLLAEFQEIKTPLSDLIKLYNEFLNNCKGKFPV